MQKHALPGNYGKAVELDLCFHCQGMWIDPKAVEQALQGYAHAVKSTTVSAHAPDVADVDL